MARAVPPVALAYQSTVCPELTEAEMFTVPVLQRAALLAVGAFGNGFTVTVLDTVAEQPAVVVPVTE